MRIVELFFGIVFLLPILCIICSPLLYFFELFFIVPFKIIYWAFAGLFLGVSWLFEKPKRFIILLSVGAVIGCCSYFVIGHIV